jgi:hypothetical protein
MKKSTRIMAVMLAVLLIPSACFAASPWVEQTTYTDKAREKFIFGFKNLAGGWTELFSEPAASLDKDENILNGIGRGLFNGLVYTVGGALHTVTFFLPVDLPIPENGVDF